MAFPILDLANELIVVILEHVDNHKDLRAIALTCSHLQDLSEPILYRSIFHTRGRQILRLSEAISNRKQRSHAIQTIESRCRHRQEGGLRELGPMIATSKNLTTLTLESPYCNHAYGGPMSNEWQSIMANLLLPVLEAAFPSGGGDTSLSRLTTLTLHLSQESHRYWDVKGAAARIFAHPTLKSLTVSCATLGNDTAENLRELPSSPLKHLGMIECNINLEAFKAIMTVPEALEWLHLGQNCYHQSMIPSDHVGAPRARADQLCGRSPTAFFEALGNQRGSLEDLTYVVRGSSSTNVKLPDECKGFVTFGKLRHITLDGHCPYFEKALSSVSTAPPQLLCLKVRGDMFRLPKPRLEPRENYQSQVDWMIIAATVVKQLQSVQIVTSKTFTSLPSKEVGAIVQLGEVFKRSKTKMEILRRRGSNYIPPFLHGEKPDTEELVYTSDGQAFADFIEMSKDRDEIKAFNDRFAVGSVLN